MAKFSQYKLINTFISIWEENMKKNCKISRNFPVKKGYFFATTTSRLMLALSWPLTLLHPWGSSKVAAWFDFSWVQKNKKNKNHRSVNWIVFQQTRPVDLCKHLIFVLLNPCPCVLPSAGHRGRSEGEEPQSGQPDVERRGAGRGALRQRTQSPVGPPQVWVCRRLLRSLKRGAVGGGRGMSELMGNQDLPHNPVLTSNPDSKWLLSKKK